MPCVDPQKRREYQKKYMREQWLTRPENRAKHHELVRQQAARYSAINRELVSKFRANGCLLCDERTECCLAAHHTDASKKDFSIGNAMTGGYSPKRVERELSKCVCVCQNCHFKVHAGILVLPEAAPPETTAARSA